MRAVALPVLFVALAACSTQPTTPQTASAPVATAPAPAVPDSATVTPPSEPATAPAVKPPGKIPSGYRRITRNGKELFCRPVVTLGSRFAEKMCFTREQLDEIASRTEATMNDIDRSMGVCAGTGDCGGT